MNRESLQVINFNTRDFRASIDIQHLVKVIALPRLMPSPDSPDYVVGLMNVAGCAVPVIDLALRLNTSTPKSYTISTPILICKTSGQQALGVLVEEVVDVGKVNPDMIEQHVSAMADVKIIERVIKYGALISLLINVDVLLPQQVRNGR